MNHSASILLLALFSSLSLLSQSPFFHHYAIGSNLSGAEKINVLYEDPLGPIWVGTDDGLLLFDGQQLHLYPKADTTSTKVTAMLRDRQQVLWIAYADGSMYQLIQEQLIAWQPEEGTPAAPITGLAEDAAGRLWFATYGEGVYFWDGKRVYNFAQEDGLLGDEIYVMQADPEGRMWCGTDAGISICSMEGYQKEITNLTTAEGIPDEIVTALHMDGKRGCWIGMHDRGVAYYNFASASFQTLFADWPYGVVSSLEQFVDQELWIGTGGKGLWRYAFSSAQLQKVDDEREQMGTKILDLQKDVEGNIWVASNTRFIHRANRQFQMLVTDLPVIQSIFHDRQNKLWIGTEEGLYSLEQSGTYKKWLDGSSVNLLSLYQDQFGNIWAGSFGEGAYCLQPSTGRWINLAENEGLTNGSVLSMDGYADRIWLATLGGVTEFLCTTDPFTGTLPTARNYNQESGLGTNFIYKVFVCRQGNVWFGTDGKGLSTLQDGVITNYTEASVARENGEVDTIALKTIYSITDDAAGNIWLTSPGNGVFKFDGVRFHQFPANQERGRTGVTSIAADNHGQLLLVYPSGIDLLEIASGRLLHYDETIGLENFEPNINVVSTDTFGHIWLAGRHELIQYTQLAEPLQRTPRIYLQQHSVGSKILDRLSTNTLAHDENNFLCQYFGLWYTDPERIHYRYRLLGNDANWKVTTDRVISYAKLSPGIYRFELATAVAAADDGVADVAYRFRINAPFWLTWWFWILVLGSSLAVIYFWQKWRDERTRKMNQLEKEKVFSQLNALKSQISPHFLFNSFNTLVGVIEENPRQAVEYVEQLADFYRAILQYRNREVILVAEELNLLKNYAYLLQRRFGNSLQLDIHLEDCPDYIPPLSLQLLVENAVKHNVISKAHPLTIRIYNDENYIYVQNNRQPKIRPSQSTRFGLESLRKRYDALGRRPLEVTFDKSHYSVNLPILKRT